MLVESVTDPSHPARSEVTKLFAESPGETDSGPLAGDRGNITRCLLNEAVGGPKVLMADVTNIRFFSLRVLRYCMEPEPSEPVPAHLIDEVLGIVGDLGDPIRKEFEATLTLREQIRP